MTASTPPKLRPVAHYAGKPFVKPGHLFGARVLLPAGTDVELAYCIACNQVTARAMSVSSAFLVWNDRHAQRNATGSVDAYTFARHSDSRCRTAGKWDEQISMVVLDSDTSPQKAGTDAAPHDPVPGP